MLLAIDGVWIPNEIGLWFISCYLALFTTIVVCMMETSIGGRYIIPLSILYSRKPFSKSVVLMASTCMNDQQ